MRLIAVKPCSFGGRKYYIGEEIPEKDVADPKLQEKMGVLAISGEASAELSVTEENGKVSVPVIRDSDGDTAEVLNILLTEGEIQQVFAILQMTVEKAGEAMEDVESEEVLIVIHAADSRAGVKKAAEKRADQLSSTEPDQNESVGGNETTEGSMAHN